MLSTSFDPADKEPSDFLRDVSRRLTTTVDSGLQDDVERLIDIAAQLFSAIERQIHSMEEELVIAAGEPVSTYTQTIFKERLIRCAESLEAALQEIALNLESRALEQSSRSPGSS